MLPVPVCTHRCSAAAARDIPLPHLDAYRSTPSAASGIPSCRATQPRCSDGSVTKPYTFVPSIQGTPNVPTCSLRKRDSPQKTSCRYESGTMGKELVNERLVRPRLRLPRHSAHLVRVEPRHPPSSCLVVQSQELQGVAFVRVRFGGVRTVRRETFVCRPWRLGRSLVSGLVAPFRARICASFSSQPSRSAAKELKE